MVTARSAAMGFNRLVDARYDALNPRTVHARAAAGAMSAREAAGLRRSCRRSRSWPCAGSWARCASGSSPVALAIVFWYSLAKRVTHLTQFFLGLAMAVAPVGGWIAAGGAWSWEPACSRSRSGPGSGGFDVLYACQDVQFDRAHGLRSIPVRFGVPASLAISRALHVVTVACFLALGAWSGSGRRLLRRRGGRGACCWPTSSRSCRPTTCRG